MNVEICSNSWLIRWATVTLKVCSTGISRFFFSLFKFKLHHMVIFGLASFTQMLLCPCSLRMYWWIMKKKKNLKIIYFGLSVLPQHLKVRCYMLSTTLDKAYDFSYWLHHVKISRQMDCCIQLVEVIIRSMMLTLLHTTLDAWLCCVLLYAILAGCLPFIQQRYAKFVKVCSCLIVSD